MNFKILLVFLAITSLGVNADLPWPGYPTATPPLCEESPCAVCEQDYACAGCASPHGMLFGTYYGNICIFDCILVGAENVGGYCTCTDGTTPESYPDGLCPSSVPDVDCVETFSEGPCSVTCGTGTKTLTYTITTEQSGNGQSCLHTNGQTESQPCSMPACLCGNGVRDPGEQCDPAALYTVGCSTDCLCAPGYNLFFGTNCIACAQGTYTSTYGTVSLDINQGKCPSVSTPVVNCATYSTTSDACTSCQPTYTLNGNTCTPPSLCGNGVLDTGEACDSGTYSSGGCSSTCTVNPG